MHAFYSISKKFIWVAESSLFCINSINIRMYAILAIHSLIIMNNLQKGLCLSLPPKVFNLLSLHYYSPLATVFGVYSVECSIYSKGYRMGCCVLMYVFRIVCSHIILLHKNCENILRYCFSMSATTYVYVVSYSYNVLSIYIHVYIYY